MKGKPVILKGGSGASWSTLREWVAKATGGEELSLDSIEGAVLQQKLWMAVNTGANVFCDLQDCPDDRRARKLLAKAYDPHVEALGGSRDLIRRFCTPRKQGVPPWAHKWMLIAGAGTGTAWHVDQFNTSAWNTLLHGRKRWLLYPPERGAPPLLENDGVPEDMTLSFRQ